MIENPEDIEIELLLLELRVEVSYLENYKFYSNEELFNQYRHCNQIIHEIE